MLQFLIAGTGPYANHMDGWGGGMWVWGLLMMLFFIAAVGLVVWAVVRGGYPAAPTAVAGDRARAILAERFARGELDTEEYHERLDALR